MKIIFPIDYYERDLIITFPDKYKSYEEEILSYLNDYYNKWINYGEIVDTEEQDYVRCSCCEEYMMECLSEVYNQWNEWELKERNKNEAR